MSKLGNIEVPNVHDGKARREGAVLWILMKSMNGFGAL